MKSRGKKQEQDPGQLLSDIITCLTKLERLAGGQDPRTAEMALAAIHGLGEESVASLSKCLTRIEDPERRLRVLERLDLSRRRFSLPMIRALKCAKSDPDDRVAAYASRLHLKVFNNDFTPAGYEDEIDVDDPEDPRPA